MASRVLSGEGAWCGIVATRQASPATHDCAPACPGPHQVNPGTTAGAASQPEASARRARAAGARRCCHVRTQDATRCAKTRPLERVARDVAPGGAAQGRGRRPVGAANQVASAVGAARGADDAAGRGFGPRHRLALERCEAHNVAYRMSGHGSDATADALTGARFLYV